MTKKVVMYFFQNSLSLKNVSHSKICLIRKLLREFAFDMF